MERFARIIGPKLVVLLQELFEKHAHPDRLLAHRYLTGFPLVGELDRTGVFTECDLEFLGDSLNPIRLARVAKERQQSLQSQVEAFHGTNSEEISMS